MKCQIFQSGISSNRKCVVQISMAFFFHYFSCFFNLNQMQGNHFLESYTFKIICLIELFIELFLFWKLIGKGKLLWFGCNI